MTDPFSTSSAPTTEPAGILQGRFVTWRRELDYDDSTYSVTYSMAGQTITGVRDGDFWEFEVTGAVSTAMTTGESRWSLLLTRLSDSEVAEIGTGYVSVFSTSDERRTHAETMVKKIESVLENRADADVESYSIKGRSITKMSPGELMKWRDYYRNEISTEGGSTTTGVKNATKVRARFI